MPRSSPTSLASLLQKTMWLFLPCCVVILGGFFYLFQHSQEKSAYSHYLEELKHSAFTNVSLLETSMENNKKNIRLLTELASTQQFVDYLNDPEKPNLPNETSKIKTDLIETFKALLDYNNDIQQVRLILQNGSEYIRVERHEGDLFVTPQNLLQSKANRDYFQIGISLPTEDVYSSLITPNYEHDQLEYPIWPTYRVTQSLRSKNNLNMALLVLNINAQQVLTHLNKPQNATGPIFESYLVGPDGYYVAAPASNILFGKELGQSDDNWFTHTENQTPLAESEEVLTNFRGQPYLFNVRNIRFSDRFPDQQYYLLTGIPVSQIEQQLSKRKSDFMISAFSFLAIAFFMILGFLRHIQRLQQLSIDQSHFQAIVSSSTDAILSVDTKGKILSWNQAATILFGLPDELSDRHNIFTLIPPGEAAQFNPESLAELVRTKKAQQLEISAKTSVDTDRRLSLMLCPIKPSIETGESIALIIRDITHQQNSQKKLETMNQALDSEVKKRTEEFEREKLKAIKANQSKSMFVANISHEIRTPLNGINGLLALARRNDDSKQDNYLKLAQDSAKSLNILINDLLDFSKIESGKLELNPTLLNLEELAEQVISSIAFLVQQKKLELILDTSGLEINRVIADENRVKQVLTNLLSNAIKFTNEGEIILSLTSHIDPASPNNVSCDFQVTDSGVGIPLEQRTKLFKPFIQASAGISNKYGGTGLGLSISKQLCELMHGRLTLESELGKGSTFNALIIGETAPSTSLPPTRKTPHLSSNAGAPLNVAILVKNPHLSRVLRKQLHQWKMNSSISRTTAELLQSIKNNKPDITIIDDIFYSHELELQLNNLAIRAIYLADNFRSSTQPAIPHYLAKPVLPSALLAEINAPEAAPTPAKQNVKFQPSDSSRPAYEQCVYVVDDNEINRIVVTGILNSLPFQLETASNGESLINKLAQLPAKQHLPVILMDCQMPVMDGYQATQMIREGKVGDWLKKAPIIALTADAMPDNKKACEAAGMNDFISKPFDPDKLIDVVLKWAKNQLNELP
ncbi:MAG: response regulator [Oleiphilus sp.]